MVIIRPRIAVRMAGDFHIHVSKTTHARITSNYAERIRIISVFRWPALTSGVRYKHYLSDK